MVRSTVCQRREHRHRDALVHASALLLPGRPLIVNEASDIVADWRYAAADAGIDDDAAAAIPT